MAAAIAAADNVTNVRCPGLPVAGVTGYGLATGSLRVTLRSIILFIAFHCQAQVTWEAFWDPSRRQKLLSCHPKFWQKIGFQEFQCKDLLSALMRIEGSPAWMSKRSKFWNMIKMWICPILHAASLCWVVATLDSGWHHDMSKTMTQLDTMKDIFNPLDFRFTKRFLQWYEHHRGLLIQRLCLVFCQNCHTMGNVEMLTSELNVACHCGFLAIVICWFSTKSEIDHFCQKISSKSPRRKDVTLDVNGTYRFAISQIYGATLAITAFAAAESPDRGFCGTEAIQQLGGFWRFC